MEDWQQWQIRADAVAAELRQEVDALESNYLAPGQEQNLRGFWPRFRALKEKVRVAPAIRLEDKLELERRLRAIGSRGYRAQEAAQSRSTEDRAELLDEMASLRTSAEQADTPRRLREVRRELDQVRGRFEDRHTLVPADRQAVWQTWRDANQFVWQLLTDQWAANEETLRSHVQSAREQLERGNAGAARQQVGRFFESLRTHEARQSSTNDLKAEAEAIRREADESEARRAVAQTAQIRRAAPAVSVDSLRADVVRNDEAIARLSEDIDGLDRQVQEAESILEQAMLRGTLVDKRRKLTELERSNRDLRQRIEQVEETPLVPAL